jgi:integrase
VTYTVGNTLDDWLAGGLSGRSDQELYRDTVKPLRERLADLELSELTAGDVQATLDTLADRLSTRSLQILRNCLERAIRHAEIRDLVGRNVAAVVKAPRGKNRAPVRELDPRAGTGTAADRPGFPSARVRVLSVMTGQRTEELRALRWNEVDLDSGTVAVYRAARVSGDTKTRKG